MELMPLNSNERELIFYFPHHCIFKESTTTSNGISLNDDIAIGKSNQSDLVELLINFRIFQYVFSADVERMYRQILIPEDQMDLHRILWRNSPNEPISEYRLKTIAYGISNAPYLAIRTLEQLAMDLKKSHPKLIGAALLAEITDYTINKCISSLIEFLVD